MLRKSSQNRSTKLIFYHPAAMVVLASAINQPLKQLGSAWIIHRFQHLRRAILVCSSEPGSASFSFSFFFFDFFEFFMIFSTRKPPPSWWRRVIDDLSFVLP